MVLTAAELRLPRLVQLADGLAERALMGEVVEALVIYTTVESKIVCSHACMGTPSVLGMLKLAELALLDASKNVP